MLPDKFETKVVEFRYSKAVQNHKKVYLTSRISHQLRRCREGELIQRWVMNEAIIKGEVKRLWISSLTTAIREGFENLKPSSNYDNLYYAGFPEPLETGYWG
jgi:DNA topoisomerase-3